MPRRRRIDNGGIIYHVINRRVGRATLFAHDADYAAFENVLAQAAERFPSMRLLAYCLMPNHWHLVLWPRRDGELSELMRRATVTHAQRLHAHRGTAGTGPVYQGRFKSFPVATDDYFLTLCRYVERNPLPPGKRGGGAAERGPWGSLSRRAAVELPATRGLADDDRPPLSPWPVDAPPGWVKLVNAPMSPAEEAAVARCVRRSSPFGSDAWSAA